MARKSRKIADTPSPSSSVNDKKAFNVALYTRLSVEDRTKSKGESIENQKNLLLQYLQDKPYLKLHSVYVDNGKTGTNFERPDFIRMMNDIKADKVDCVIVKDLSRLGRNYIETGDILENVFPFLNVRFIAINDNYDTLNSSNNDGIIVPLKNLINDVYAKDISQKVMSSFKTKQKKGEFLGAFAPYGYLKSEENKHKLVIDTNVDHIVKDIFKWKLEGLGDVKIVNKLNDLGIAPPNKYRYEQGILTKARYGNMEYWHKSAIKRIIVNPVYLGNMVQAKQVCSIFITKSRIELPSSEWIVVEQTHEPIIDRDTFFAVQSIKSNRREEYDASIGKHQNLSVKENIFKGIIVCGDCKRTMIRHRVVLSDNKVRYALLCPTYESTSKNACSKKRMYEDELVPIIQDAIRQQIHLANKIKKEIFEVNTSHSYLKSVTNIQNEISKMKQQLSRTTMLKNSLYQDYAEQILTANEYVFTKQKYESDINALQAKLDELDKQKMTYSENYTEKNKWIKSFDDFYNFQEVTKDVVVQLIEQVEIYDDKSVAITFKFKDEYENIFEYINEVRAYA